VVTDLLTRPESDELVRPVTSRSVLVGATVAAGWVAALGLAGVTVVVMAAWTASTATATAASALRMSVGLWLLAQHVPLRLGTGHAAASIGLLPLGATLVIGALLVRAGRSLARNTDVRSARDAWTATGGLAASYAVFCAAVAVAGAGPDVHAHAGGALAAGWLLALLCGGAGVLTASGIAGSWAARLPRATGPVARAAALALAALIGCAALLTAGALVAHHARAAAISGALGPGAVGGIALAVLQIAYLPTVVVWATAYVVGPGFAVGAGTSYSAWGVAGGPTPAVPVLAALPGGPAPGWGKALALLVPIAAGAAAGWLVGRDADPRPIWRAPVLALTAGAAAAVVLAVAAVLAGGPLGPGAMATVGPSAWQVGLLAAAELGGAAAASAAVTQVVAAHRWRLGRSGRTGRSASLR
jgi:hypothetical protein